MSWKTTLFGLVTALAGFILFSPQYFQPWAIDLAKYVMVGGFAALGLAAKDFNVSTQAAPTRPESTEKKDG